MKDHILFAQALIRLDRHPLGLSEAVTLFCLGGGSTAVQVANATGVELETVKGRLGQLRRKKLVVSTYNEQGAGVYRPTEKGLAIIQSTLKSTDQ